LRIAIRVAGAGHPAPPTSLIARLAPNDIRQ
jgi:hypothetical protein